MLPLPLWVDCAERRVEGQKFCGTVYVVLPWAAMDEVIVAECPNIASTFLVAVYQGKLDLHSSTGFMKSGGVPNTARWPTSEKRAYVYMLKCCL